MCEVFLFLEIVPKMVCEAGDSLRNYDGFLDVLPFLNLQTIATSLTKIMKTMVIFLK
jgi:hypothetical protein